ncbi:MAG: putative glycolipid-binding domain-containing protein [Alphaproteobacteria bacterium]|nr:putative glycolipid-binding domain-containing protein [Alphaproteobacteria bacterium]
MKREAMWAPASGTGLESLRLERDGNSWVADGIILGLRDGRPFRCIYQLTCDRAWNVRQVSIDIPGGEPAVLRLRADGKGGWETALGEPQNDLAGALTVDLSATPFTNTLEIRRLRLEPGQAQDVVAAHVDIPSLALRPARQRYTCLAAATATTPGRYRYEDSSGFAAELTVDADGLVIDYPGQFARAWADAATDGGGAAPGIEPGLDDPKG